MAESAPAIVRRWVEVMDVDLVAWANDDALDRELRERAEPLLEPDFEFFDSPGTASVGIPSYGRGWEFMRENYRRFTEMFERYRERAQEWTDLGEGRILVLGAGSGLLRGSEVEIGQSGGAIYTVRDGRIAAIELFLSREEAVAAAGAEADA